MYNIYNSIYNRWVFLTLGYFVLQNKILLHLRPGEGGIPYESDGDARRKIRIKPLRPIWAWLRFYLTPKGDHAKTDNQVKVTVILNALKIDAKN